MTSSIMFWISVESYPLSINLSLKNFNCLDRSVLPFVLRIYIHPNNKSCENGFRMRTRSIKILKIICGFDIGFDIKYSGFPKSFSLIYYCFIQECNFRLVYTISEF